MKKIVLLGLFLGCFTLTYSQSVWNKVNNQKVELSTSLSTDNVEVYSFDFNQLKETLEKTPKEFTKSIGNTIEIPFPKEGMKEFEVWNSSIMEEGLQQKFPNILSFKAKEINGSTVGRFDVSINGFYGSFNSSHGTYYIEPNAKKLDQVAVYFHRDVEMTSDNRTCGVDDHEFALENERYKQMNEYKDKPIEKRGGEPVELRVYRIAVAVSGEWYQSHGDGSIESAMAKVNTTMNRVNEIYERDVALRMVLIANNDQLIFTDSNTDPYNQPTSGGATVGTNTVVLNNQVGVNSYDIGHVFMKCTDVGGVASGRLCDDGGKGNGVTCWYGDDPFGIAGGTLSHELGHQMSAPHTWSNCGFPGQLSTGSAYEPGSGNTILSYSGACGDNNTSGRRDAYFHINSCNSIITWSRLSIGNTCASFISTGNTNPTATHNYVNGFTIPIRTPFRLEGDATDIENDDMTYKWEQYDLGPESTLGSPMGNAPCFKAYEQNDVKYRVFPQISDIVNNRSNKSEVLVDYTRDFTFRFIVRDNNQEAGGLDYAEVEFKTTDSAGPFEVLYPNSREDLVVGDEIPIVWEVANTDGDLVNCQKVNILYSIDGGFTWELLVSGTPNDGDENIVIPNTPSNVVRFVVQAADNIFFDMSDLNSKIEEPTSPTYVMDYPPITEEICLPNSLVIPIQTTGFLGFNESINFEIVSGLPDGATANFSNNNIIAGGSTNLTFDFEDEQNTGTYEIILRSTSSDSGITLDRTLTVSIISNDYSDLVLLTPENGGSGMTTLPTFTWTESSAASSYTLEIATAPTFGASNVIYETELTGTDFTPPALLDNNTLYYWRVNGSNSCGSTIGKTNGFHTASLQCEEYAATDLPINISASGTRVIESDIQIFESGAVQDANVSKIAGLHDRTSDLRMTLTSPSGIEVLLINRKCGNLQNFDMGFDDEAPSTVSCPITTGTSYVPAEPLSAFINEERMGTWTLTIEDLAPGNGGRLNDFSLELCASFSVVAPMIDLNELLMVDDLSTETIGSDFLSSSDPNNSAAQLTYTMVSNTSEGDVSKGGQVLTVGDQFTQADVDNGDIQYTHTGAGQINDSFDFAVQDGEGGWDGVQTFRILIDTESAVNDLEDQVAIKLFPNPANDVVYIQLDQVISSSLVQIFAVNGQVVYSKQVQSLQNLKINTSDFNTGLYFVKIAAEDGVSTKKLIVNR